MAQPNVAREPSMEEILASIRRIIESNEPATGKPASPPLYAVSDEDDDGDIHLTVDDAFETEEFSGGRVADPRFVAANSPGEAAPVEAPQRTMSLADVAARVRAASERGAAQTAGTREAPQQRELPPAMAARFAEARSAADMEGRPDERPEPAAPRAPFASEPLQPAIVSPAPVIAPFPAQATVAVPADEKMPVEAAPVAAEASMEAPFAVPANAAVKTSLPAVQGSSDYLLPFTQEENHPALLSEAAGAQVARSFDELVAAVDGSERRSLDEIAQEMLRPMLQEWLDDNLPTLVERLVREEIERVARGPRR